MTSTKRVPLCPSYSKNNEDPVDLTQLICSCVATHLSPLQRFNQICRSLFQMIDNLPTPVFALPKVLMWIRRVNEEALLQEPFQFNNFEMWIQTQQEIDEVKQLEIRAKISGRCIPRDEYQSFFPIGMGKQHAGNHFVTAHSSPDLDTAIASFWSWIDAFAAKVSTGLHLWNVPGLRLSDQDDRLFTEYFGSGLFEWVAKGQSLLSLKASDLAAPSSLIRYGQNHSIQAIDSEHFQKGVILVDEDGYYLGDWLSSDVESTHGVIALFHEGLLSFESKLQSYTISLFAKPQLHKSQVEAFILEQSQSTLFQIETFKELIPKQREQIERYLEQIFLIKDFESPLSICMSDFSRQLLALGLPQWEAYFADFSALLTKDDLFDDKGYLRENRPAIMREIDHLFQVLGSALSGLQSYTQTLGCAMRIKNSVLNIANESISSKADIEEVRDQIKGKSHLTVVYPEREGKLIPLGVLYADIFKRKILGTVSLRDFSNRDEVKISSYLEVISIIDHHKSDIHVSSAPVVMISDTQSCNTLMAEIQMALNDRYSVSGMSQESIAEQIATLLEKRSKQQYLETQDQRLLQRLMKRESASSLKGYYVDPEREKLEYLFYLYAILDDTDLLTKVCARDLICVCNLLNKIQSLEQAKEVELLDLSDLPRSSLFIELARARVLHHDEMYKLYSKAYGFKELSLRAQILACGQKKPHTLFSDTKIQNNCARIGQIKLSSQLRYFFEEQREHVLSTWLKDCEEVYHISLQVDLYMQMISTVAGADEVYKEKKPRQEQQDELWIWIPEGLTAHQNLITFLRGFRYARELEGLTIDVEYFRSSGCLVNTPGIHERTNGSLSGYLSDGDLKSLLTEHFIAPNSWSENSSLLIEKGTLLSLKFEAYRLNSRKAAISPYLPSNS